MKNKIIFLTIFFICSCFLSASAQAEEKTVLSPVYIINKIYKSMMGPRSSQKIYLTDGKNPELLWITGYKAVMVGADGKTRVPQEFMCHSNLDYIPVSNGYQKSYGDSRLFTLSQGQFSIELPTGFGIPVMGSEPLSLTTQVLNLNIKNKVFKVRHLVTIEFTRNSNLKEPLKPLFPGAAYGIKILNNRDGYYGVMQANQKKYGDCCLVGQNASKYDFLHDAYGRVFTGHWVVKPGREVNRALVTKIMNLPYDTTIHYIAVHLHPYAESLELVDLTTGKSLFKSNVRGFSDKIGISHVDYFSSPKGILVYKDHEYQIISIYNNTTHEDQDSMAVMYLYLLDKDFKATPGIVNYLKGLMSLLWH